jgi:hypothetical protein
MNTDEVTPTDRATLIQHEGHPVPWVTRWTGEAHFERLNLSLDRSNRLTVGYADGNEDRDRHGVLWQREKIKRSGVPQWAEVSTYRQRAAMRHRKCQVCGNKIPEQVIRWLIPKKLLETTPDGRTVTMSAPTCAGCIPVALDLCPHLKAGDWVIANVLEYREWGVWGEAVLWNGEEYKHEKNIMYEYMHEYEFLSSSAVIAKQLVVELTKFTLESP